MIVTLQNAVTKDGRKCVAYLGGDGCQGFNTDQREDAHDFEDWKAEEFARHFRGWYRGFAGEVNITVEQK